MQNFTMTQTDLDAWNKPLKEISRKAAQSGPHRPWLRRVSELKLEMQRLVGDQATSPDGFEGILPRFKRNLTDAVTLRDDTKTAIGRAEKNLDELRKSGADSRHQRVLELTGFDFKNKYGEVVHHAGIIENLKAKLADVERRIETLKVAVESTQKRVDVELPRLQKELDEAIKREGLNQ